MKERKKERKSKKKDFVAEVNGREKRGENNLTKDDFDVVIHVESILSKLSQMPMKVAAP